jgi:hypothetical protein
MVESGIECRALFEQQTTLFDPCILKEIQGTFETPFNIEKKVETF